MRHYRAGQLQQAIAALPAADGQSTYAAACLFLEAGNPESSLKTLNRLTLLETSDQLQLLGRIMKVKLEQRNRLPAGP